MLKPKFKRYIKTKSFIGLLKYGMLKRKSDADEWKILFYWVIEIWDVKKVLITDKIKNVLLGY